MQPDLRPFDLPTLIELLAEETQKYTSAYISGNLKKTAMHREIIDALVEEITLRKKAALSGKTASDIPSEK